MTQGTTQNGDARAARIEAIIEDMHALRIAVEEATRRLDARKR